MSRASPVAQMVKTLPAIWETWVRSWVGKIPWRREWQPTAVFLSGEFHGQRSLAGYNSWGHKESDMTEWLTLLLWEVSHRASPHPFSGHSWWLNPFSRPSLSWIMTGWRRGSDRWRGFIVPLQSLQGSVSPMSYNWSHKQTFRWVPTIFLSCTSYLSDPLTLTLGNDSPQAWGPAADMPAAKVVDSEW